MYRNIVKKEKARRQRVFSCPLAPLRRLLPFDPPRSAACGMRLQSIKIRETSCCVLFTCFVIIKLNIDCVKTIWYYGYN